MTTVVLAPTLPVARAVVMQELTGRGVGCRPFFHPLSFLPAYAHLPQSAVAARRNRRAYAIAPQGINLPGGFNMTPELADQVCDHLRAALGA